MMSFPIMAPRIPRRTGVTACRMAIHRGGVGLAVVVCSSIGGWVWGLCVFSIGERGASGLGIIVAGCCLGGCSVVRVGSGVRGGSGLARGGGGCVFLGLAG